MKPSVSAVPRERSGANGAPASERVGGCAGAKPPAVEPRHDVPRSKSTAACDRVDRDDGTPGTGAAVSDLRADGVAHEVDANDHRPGPSIVHGHGRIRADVAVTEQGPGG